jgi:hypothetical protein
MIFFIIDYQQFKLKLMCLFYKKKQRFLLNCVVLLTENKNDLKFNFLSKNLI